MGTDQADEIHAKDGDDVSYSRGRKDRIDCGPGDDNCEEVED